MSQLYSRLLDILEEERVKGKTFEYNRVEFTFKDRKFTLRDNPGHKMFIHSMIDGVTTDVNNGLIACLLTSASPGGI